MSENRYGFFFKNGGNLTPQWPEEMLQAIVAYSFAM